MFNILVKEIWLQTMKGFWNDSWKHAYGLVNCDIVHRWLLSMGRNDHNLIYHRTTFLMLINDSTFLCVLACVYVAVNDYIAVQVVPAMYLLEYRSIIHWVTMYSMHCDYSSHKELFSIRMVKFLSCSSSSYSYDRSWISFPICEYNYRVFYTYRRKAETYCNTKWSLLKRNHVFLFFYSFLMFFLYFLDSIASNISKKCYLWLN